MDPALPEAASPLDSPTAPLFPDVMAFPDATLTIPLVAPLSALWTSTSPDAPVDEAPLANETIPPVELDVLLPPTMVTLPPETPFPPDR